MNGIEKITERIIQDAQQEIAEITSDARQRAEEISAKYAAAAKREKEEYLSRGRAAADDRVERLASVAMLDSKKLELGAKQEMLAQAFERSLEQMTQLPEDQYVTLLAKLAANASQTGKEQIILSQKDRTRFGKKIVTEANAILSGNGSLTLSEESRPMKGGLMLSDGDIELNCTFESLIRLLKTEIATEVAGVLFS